MVGILIAVVGIAVLVVAIFALRHPHNKATAAGTATMTQTVPARPSASTPVSSGSGSRSGDSSTGSSIPASTSSSPLPLKAAISLVVLNNTSQEGLAQQVSHTFEGGGWHVTSYADNYHNNIISTAAYFDPTVARAKTAAEALQHEFPAIQRVVPKFAGLPAGPVVVVIDPDYSSN